MLNRTWINQRIAKALAAELLAGAWNRRTLLRRAEKLLGGRAAKARARLIAGVLAGATEPYPPSPARLAKLMMASPNFEGASEHAAKNWQGLPNIPRPPRFAPSPRFASLDVPKLTTLGDLAAWLEISPADLDWFTDARRLQGRTAIPDLQHYTYHFIAKASGPPRLIEAPKPRLKATQRRILSEILGKAPVHDCAFGFVAARSCIGAAQRHAGETVVIAADLKDFFTSTPIGRVHGIFRCFGYPWAVARALTNLSGTSTPEAAFLRLPPAQRPDWITRRLCATPHLAQGAPTSPALANLAALGLDKRLSGLAAVRGGRYTRYADDLAFSGDAGFARRTDGLLAAVARIVADEGYRLNARKTRIMRAGHAQRLTGIMVNAHVNLPRESFDALKATLHNCARHGPLTQNHSGHPDFRAHLSGRVGWAEQLNPLRGAKLRAMFEQIVWAES